MVVCYRKRILPCTRYSSSDIWSKGFKVCKIPNLKVYKRGQESRDLKVNNAL
jgi:hypothetical protein